MQKSILIVEDNELTMQLFNDLLEAHGYKPMPSRSDVEALEIARLHKPDLIVMDIQLPDVSGLQVTQWIKEDEHLRHIPVIAITGFAMKGDEEKIREGGLAERAGAVGPACQCDHSDTNDQRSQPE